MKAAGPARVRLGARGWRVRITMTDTDGSRRVYTARHDDWTDALDHANELASIGQT